jgi:putative transposase
MAGMSERHTTFHFTLEPTVSQVETLRRHVGAARFAFNQCLRFVKDALAAKKEDSDVPWSGFDLINGFNGWKLTASAGHDEEGRAGLSWRSSVSQQVFEESAVDLGRALSAFLAGRKGERRGTPPKFPRFKKKSSARSSFRLRNKGKGERTCIRVGAGSERTIRLPTMGQLRVRECTRSLRRMVRKQRAKILFATVSFRSDGRWHITLNVEAKEFHPERRHPPKVEHAPVGIDRGLRTFAVVGDGEGRELERVDSPRPLWTRLSVLRRKNKDVSRKEVGSRNRHRAREKVAKTHARISYVRRDFVHRFSSRLAKKHGLLVIEDLCTKGLLKTRLARSIADSAWALFATLLKYKSSWYGGTVIVADRFYPSTRRCSACGGIGEKLELSERTFHCSGCGHEADRDTNAAANLANYLKVARSDWSRVAAKHAETINVCGEESADARPLVAARETLLDEAERASAHRPRRAVLAVKTVNRL